jgi:lipopolysaccharide/colanic/teichoic acid biosynthesis glycosyltransferase
MGDKNSHTTSKTAFPSRRISDVMDVLHPREGHVSANWTVTVALETEAMNRAAQSHARGVADEIEGLEAACNHAPAAALQEKQPSPWAQSGIRRFFDCVCVLLVLPLLVPVLLAIALAVRLTSPGPTLFLQKRMGRHGRIFTILKFRTMIHTQDRVYCAVSTASNEHFTPIGPFLRHWKLDELPQLLNVLWGDMSLVGSRPKMPEHVITNPVCRPGITGAATIAFAREAAILDSVPKHHLEAYYHTVVLPAKRRLDVEYMARATFLSDLKLIVKTVLRHWDCPDMEALLNSGAFAFETENRMSLSRTPDSEAAFTSVPISLIARQPSNVDRPIRAEQVADL